MFLLQRERRGLDIGLSFVSGKRPIARLCEYVNEFSGSMRARGYLEILSEKHIYGATDQDSHPYKNRNDAACTVGCTVSSVKK
jgi:hypothetical protein